MKNQVQGISSIYLMHETEFDEKTFVTKFDSSLIVGAELIVTLQDGSLHNFSVMDFLEINWTSFIDNKKSLSCNLVTNEK